MCSYELKRNYDLSCTIIFSLMPANFSFVRYMQLYCHRTKI